MTADNTQYDQDYASDLDLDDDNNDHAAKQASFQSETQAMKKQIRDQLQSDIDAFLRSGGQVQNIGDNVRADPPRKPDQQYGSGPI